jgi:hypothetical protein
MRQGGHRIGLKLLQCPASAPVKQLMSYWTQACLYSSPREIVVEAITGVVFHQQLPGYQLVQTVHRFHLTAPRYEVRQIKVEARAQDGTSL